MSLAQGRPDFCAINTTPMLRPANLLLSLAILSFITVIGGATYEHLAVVPQWSAAPPASLAMFQGSYGLKAEHFWMPIHPVTLLLMIAALVLNWKGPRRRTIAACLTSYFVILVITGIHFVPELIAITTTAFSDGVDPSLQARAASWETLSIIRLVLLDIIALFLLSALALPAKKVVVQ